MLLIFATGMFDTPGRTARSSLLPEIAERARVPLERAVGTFEALERSARLVGGPVAGLLVAALGPVNTLVINAVTFAVSALVVARLVPRSVDAVRTAGDGSLSAESTSPSSGGSLCCGRSRCCWSSPTSSTQRGPP